MSITSDFDVMWLEILQGNREASVEAEESAGSSVPRKGTVLFPLNDDIPEGGGRAASGKRFPGIRVIRRDLMFVSVFPSGSFGPILLPALAALCFFLFLCKRAGKRGLRLLLLILPAVLLPAAAVTVRAEDSVCSDGVCLGTGTISNPTSISDSDPWSGSYVYYGKYDGQTPDKYRVLTKYTDRYGGKTMLLDCDSALYVVPFDADGNRQWANSDVKNGLNSGLFLNKAGVFTDVEKNAIAASTVDEHDLVVGDGDTNIDELTKRVFKQYVALNGEKIFLLDVEEVFTNSYGYNTGSQKKSDSYVPYDYWWLRSTVFPVPEFGIQMGVGAVSKYGGIIFADEGYNYGVSPAFNVDLSSVIFSYEIPSASSQYKLSLLDKALVISLPTGKSASIKGSTITVPFSISGSNASNATRVLVLVTDRTFNQSDAGWSDGVVIKQIAFQSDPSAGEVSFDLNSDLDISQWGSTYHVYLAAEDVNDGSLTNYASAPVELSAPTDEHNWTYAAHGAEITASCDTLGHTSENAVLRLSAPAGELIYDGTAKEASYSITPEGSEAFGTPDIVYKHGETVLTSAPLNAGDYTASVTLTSVKTAAGEGQSVTAAVDYTINPKSVTVTGVKAADRTYEPGNLSVELYGGEVAGKVESDDVSVDLSAAAGTIAAADAGTDKEVTVTGVSLTGGKAGNYVLSAQPAAVTVTIAKAPITPVVEMNGYTYGDDPIPAPKLAEGGNPGGGTVTYYYSTSDSTGSGTKWENINGTTLAANTYYMYAEVSETDNYSEAVSAAKAFTVGQTGEAVVTITGHQNTVSYDGQEHSVSGYDVQINNTKYSEADFSFIGTAEAKQTVAGTAVMGLTADMFTNRNGNFSKVTFNVTDGFQTVTQKPVTVTAIDQSIKKGEDIQTGPEWAELEGAVEGNVLSDVTLRTYGTQIRPSDAKIAQGSAQPKGDYTAPYDIDVTDNYDITYVPGTLTVVSDPVSYRVTFKVMNGAWNDGNRSDVTVTLSGNEGDTLKLSADQIPGAGSAPDEGFKAGSWDTEPDTNTPITEDVTYIYTYDPDETPEPEPEPERPGIDFFRLHADCGLPATGFSSLRPTVLPEQPKDLRYEPVRMHLMLPTLDREIGLVTMPREGNSWAAAWLGSDAGILEGSALPGEGLSVIAGHNTLNDTDYGPFALLSTLEVNDTVMVREESGALILFRVYANELLEPDDMERLSARAGDDALVLLTCENESPSGTYLNRRAVFAR